MKLDRTARTALSAIAAVVLLAALAFLFLKTESGGFQRRVEALSRVTELRDTDQRWDLDAAALRGAPGATALPPIDRAPGAARALKELRMAASGFESPALAASLAGIEQGVTAKAKAIEELRARQRDTASAREALEKSAAAAREALDGARARDPRRADGALAAAQGLDAASAALAGMAERRDGASLAYEKHLAAFSVLPAGEPAAAAAADFASAARGFAAALAADEAAHARFAAIPVGLRLAGVTRGLAGEITATLDEQDRYRAYLFAYAAALLVLAAWLTTRIVAAHAALTAANESLERRVAERTRDLSKALAQLKESEAQLVQTEKMSSLGQMVAGVAHEINTPLAYVKNSVATVRGRMPELQDAVRESGRLLELLGGENADPADLQETFSRLSQRLAQLREHHVLEDLETLTKDGLHGIDQISELVVNLRNFSRLDRSKVASFNVNEGVQSTLLIAKTQLRKVDIEKELGDIPSITCSPSQVNQVLLNLVTNAAQAIDKPRGLIRVRTRPEGAGAVAIEVTDNGKGIPPDVLPKIFDPFFTTKEVGKGTGLGLSIAYKIVQQHGGRIDVKSRVGEGTTFTVVLPFQPPAELAASVEGGAGA